jgi:hypothetical protein
MPTSDVSVLVSETQSKSCRPVTFSRPFFRKLYPSDGTTQRTAAVPAKALPGFFFLLGGGLYSVEVEGRVSNDAHF